MACLVSLNPHMDPETLHFYEDKNHTSGKLNALSEGHMTSIWWSWDSDSAILTSVLLCKGKYHTE